MFSREVLIEAAIEAAEEARGWEAQVIGRVLLGVGSKEADDAVRVTLEDESWQRWSHTDLWSQDWTQIDVTSRCLKLIHDEGKSNLEALTFLPPSSFYQIEKSLGVGDCPLRNSLLLEKAPPNHARTPEGAGNRQNTVGPSLWLERLERHLRGGPKPVFKMDGLLEIRPTWAPSEFCPIFRDPLAGALHRRALASSASDVFCKKRNWKGQGQLEVEGQWLFLMDIDHLMLLNDREGMKAGDGAIQRVAFALQEVVGDRVIRYGGDEFLVIVEDGDGEEIAELMRSHVQESAPLTVSIGGVRTTGKPASDLQRAEALMVEAKRAGRNQQSMQ